MVEFHKMDRVSLAALPNFDEKEIVAELLGTNEK